MTIQTTMEHVLRTEAAGILALASRWDESFAEAVRMMNDAAGRIVVTGMGKSGHIARKISATLASTGTPSFFLHPAEAIHGDLGMVTEDDVVLALSNSGETGEIIGILPSLRRIGARLIAVVGNPGSTLGKRADITLDVSVEEEACPLGLAPTTSTTVALAVGDALAIALMEMHGFTADRFALFHPGGSLGRKLLLTVADIMHKEEQNPVVASTTTVQNALFEMTAKGLGATSVVDEQGALVGLVTDGDIRRALEKGTEVLQVSVAEIMTRDPHVITSEKLAAQALHVMQSHEPRPITVLPVVGDASQPIGMVHLTDLLRQGVV